MMAASLSLSPWNNSAVPPCCYAKQGYWLDETTINNTVIQTIGYQL
jgi:hypothetical protein